MPPRNTNCLGVYLPPLSSVVQETDNKPYGKAQGKDADGNRGYISGNVKANTSILIWRGLKNPEVVFCFRLTALDGGQTKKRGEASSFVPLSFPVLQ